jgi:hypothetical protein
MSPLDDSLTPVFLHLQTCTYASLLGHVAVKHCCQKRLCKRTCVTHSLSILESLDAAA